MDVTSDWRWWLVIGSSFLGLAVSAIGTFGRRLDSDRYTFVGMVLTLVPIGVEWLRNGFASALVVALIAHFISRPLANGLTVQWLISRGEVYPDANVVLDIARAESKQENHMGKVKGKLGSAPGEAFKEFDRGNEEMAQYLSVAVNGLRAARSVIQSGLDPSEIEELVRYIQRYMGPIGPVTLFKIASNPAVLEVFQEQKSAGWKDDTLLFGTIYVGRRPY